MKNDERIHSDVKTTKSIGYMFFWIGIFGVLLYRWFVLNESFLDTLDFFLVWFLASLVQFFALAFKGIPITYPVAMDNKEQLYYLFLVPLFTGVLVAIIVYLRIGMDVRRIFYGCILTFFITFLLFIVYRYIVALWEKRNT
jgi:hypothetical protein